MLANQFHKPFFKLFPKRISCFCWSKFSSYTTPFVRSTCDTTAWKFIFVQYKLWRSKTSQRATRNHLIVTHSFPQPICSPSVEIVPAKPKSQWRFMGVWEGLEPPPKLALPHPLVYAWITLIPSEARLYQRSIRRRFRQPEVGLKTSISQEWCTGSLSDWQS